MKEVTSLIEQVREITEASQRTYQTGYDEGYRRGYLAGVEAAKRVIARTLNLPSKPEEQR